MHNNPVRHILVTGASGYVGHHVAATLALAGPVAGTHLTRPVSAPRVEPVPIDLTDGPAVRRLFRDLRPAAIVHCAAETNVSRCEENPTEARAAILDATMNLLSARAEFAVGSPFLGFSTDLVFSGDAAPYSESAPAKPLNMYGGLKCAAEEKILAAGGIVLRSALVFGAPVAQRQTFLSWMKDRMEAGTPLDLFTDEIRTPIFIGDLVAAVKLLLSQQDSSGVYHAGGCDSLSREQMGRTFGEVFGLSTDSIHAVGQKDLAGGELRPADVSLTSSRLQSLGWKQKPFKDGLVECRRQWP